MRPGEGEVDLTTLDGRAKYRRAMELLSPAAKTGPGLTPEQAGWVAEHLANDCIEIDLSTTAGREDFSRMRDFIRSVLPPGPGQSWRFFVRHHPDTPPPVAKGDRLEPVAKPRKPKKPKWTRRQHECERCGKSFTATGRQIYCTATCRSNASGKRVREKYRARAVPIPEEFRAAEEFPAERAEKCSDGVYRQFSSHVEAVLADGERYRVEPYRWGPYVRMTTPDVVRAMRDIIPTTPFAALHVYSPLAWRD